MDNIGETREAQPKPERIIVPNQEFAPFDPLSSRSYIFDGYNGLRPINSLSSKIRLAIRDKIIPLIITTLPFRGARKLEMITPFDPELGYTITNEDMNREARSKKLIRLSSFFRTREEEYIDFNKAPTALHVMTSSFDLPPSRNLDKTKDGNYFGQEMLELLSGLRIQVFVSKLALEAKPNTSSLQHGEIFFNDYYPRDTGPLPPVIQCNNQGFYIALPDDPEKLAQIGMKFVLVNKDQEE